MYLEFVFPVTSPGQSTLILWVLRLKGTLAYFTGTSTTQVYQAKLSCTSPSFYPFLTTYSSSLWDTNYAVHANKLESVEKFAAKFVTKRWSDNLRPPAKPTQLASCQDQKEKAETLVVLSTFEGLFTYSAIPILTPSHTLHAITISFCTILFVTQLLTYLHFVLVLYPYGWHSCGTWEKTSVHTCNI